MANTFNTGVYPQEWATKLQERLNAPTNWKEVANVIYTDSQVLNLPYMSTESVIQTGTRGTAYGFSDFALTNDTLTISTYKPVPMFIDRADLAQCTLVNQMELADRQGAIIAEHLESSMLAQHSLWTDFDNASIGGSAGNITVSASNIDDIIRGVKREIRENNCQDLANKNGVFIVWRPADFELLEAYVQANGFREADIALKEGTMPGLRYMGVDHYVSNSHTSGHLFGGVKKVHQIGILKATYGQIVVTQDPSLQSGLGIVSRVDFGHNVPTGHITAVFDILVA